MSGRIWIMEMPPCPPDQLLNSNGSHGHWAAKQAKVNTLRDIGETIARAHRLPVIQRARIVAVYQPPQRRRMDPANWQPTVKAYIDGLVRAGVLPDDNADRLLGPDMRLGEPHPPHGRMVLRIQELPEPLTLQCRSRAAARDLVTAARDLIYPGVDVDHQARASGRTVTLTFTDPQWAAALTQWAAGQQLTEGHPDDTN